MQGTTGDHSRRLQGGEDSGRSQGGEESRRNQARSQSTAKMKSHGRTDGGRRQGGYWNLGGGNRCKIEEAKTQGDTGGLDGRAGAAGRPEQIQRK